MQSKTNFSDQKTHFIDIKPQETIGKCKNRCFSQNGPFFERPGGPRRVMWSKKIFDQNLPNDTI